MRLTEAVGVVCMSVKAACALKATQQWHTAPGRCFMVHVVLTWCPGCGRAGARGGAGGACARAVVGYQGAQRPGQGLNPTAQGLISNGACRQNVSSILRFRCCKVL